MPTHAECSLRCFDRVRAVGGLLWWDQRGVERRVDYVRGTLYSFPARMTHATAPFAFDYWRPLRVNLQWWSIARPDSAVRALIQIERGAFHRATASTLILAECSAML